MNVLFGLFGLEGLGAVATVEGLNDRVNHVFFRLYAFAHNLGCLVHHQDQNYLTMLEQVVGRCWTQV